MTIDATNKPTRPDFEKAEFRAGKYARALCRDLMDGTSAIRAGGETYLPRWPAEKKKYWRIRAKVTQVARYYQRAVQASVGMILATPPKLDENAAAVIKADVEDIDGKGTHLEVFAKACAEDAINGGFTCILVEWPPVPDGWEPTLADEEALGLRPYWVHVSADRVVSWLTESPNWKALLAGYIGGALTAEQVKSLAKQTILRQVVIHEPTEVVAGDYGTVTVDRYRVLRLTDAGVTFKVLEKQKSQEATADDGVVFVVVGEGTMKAGGQPLREIPLAVIYGGVKRAEFVAEPPMLGLSELNLEHYQVSADRRYLMRLCHAPTFATIGMEEKYKEDGTEEEEVIELGPNTALKLPKGGDAKYVVAPADALNSSKEEKDELVQQMATLGMSFLAKNQRKVQETALGRSLDDAAENATHATSARGLQDGLEEALRFHAMYRKVGAPSVSINTTYASPQVDPQIAAVLWSAVAADKLDVESWIAYIQTGQLPDDVAARLAALRLSKALQDATPPEADPSITKDPAPAPDKMAA